MLDNQRDFAPSVRKLFLSPRNPTPYITTQTIGYFYGDVPSIIAHIGHEAFEIKMGQCIPTGGRQVMLENPYSRSANVQVTMNSAPTFQQSTDAAFQEEYVSYRGNVLLNESATTGEFRGVALMPNRGKFIVEFESKIDCQVSAYSRFGPNDLAARPTGFLEDDFTLNHANGAALDNIVSYSGYFTVNKFNTWLEPVNSTFYNLRTMAGRVRSGRFLLEEGGLFLLSQAGVEPEQFNASFKIREFARTEGITNV